MAEISTERIVVGVDGSQGAAVALAWALREARWRDAIVEVVHVWHYPYVPETAWLQANPANGDFEEPARMMLDDIVEHARLEVPGVEIEAILLGGDAAATLIESAKGADLLVVGSRGRGGFAGLLLGSVSQQCAHHPPCPLAIIPR